MKRQSCLPNDPKIVVSICFGAFWICNKVLSYGRLTINFRVVVFTYTRWLFSCGITFLPDAHGEFSSRLEFPYSDECQTKEAFKVCQKNVASVSCSSYVL